MARNYGREYEFGTARVRARGFFKSRSHETRQRARVRAVSEHPVRFGERQGPGSAQFPLYGEAGTTYAPRTIEQARGPSQREQERAEQEGREIGGVAGLQGPTSVSPEPDWDYYWPTRTSWPAGSSNKQGPRTLQARYSARLYCLEVIFRDGTPWRYTQVPPSVWTKFKRVESPGKFINESEYLTDSNNYRYGGWGILGGCGVGDQDEG